MQLKQPDEQLDRKLNDGVVCGCSRNVDLSAEYGWILVTIRGC